MISNIKQTEQINIITWKYDKYDIIDYLDNIPIKIWTKFYKDLEKEFIKINNPQMINYLLNKIKIDLPTYINYRF